jgi:drug/metabolite transporter (DMT)-like permease
LAFVAGIVVLVQLFKKEGVWKGILGLICMLYTYIWGWMHVKDESLKLKTWMWIWTGAIILGIILSVIGQVQANVAQSLGG